MPTIDANRYKTVLNLGAGPFDSPQYGLLPLMEYAPIRVAVELHPQSASTWVDSSWVPLIHDMADLDIFPDKSFDLVMALDAIEHLEKSSGEMMLDGIDRICKKTAIIMTPEGFLDTVKYQSELIGDNSCRIHLSGWEAEDFLRRDYDVDISKEMHKFGDVSFNVLFCIKEFEK